MNLLLCPDAAPSLAGLFDLSIAPPLLFYSYIPIFVLSLFFGFFILIKDKCSIISQYFLVITLFFASYVLLSILQWTAAHVQIVHLSWQLYLFAEVGIFLYAVPFAYAFLHKESNKNPYHLLIILITAVLAIILPTSLNIAQFNFENCEGISGAAWPFIYVLEIICLIVLIRTFLVKLRETKGKNEKMKDTLFSVGLFFFLSIFWASNYFGEMTQTYEFNLIGPIGMIVFLCSLSYLLVKFKIFNTKLFTSQILVLILGFLIGSILFIRKIEYIHIVVLFTFGLVCILGAILIKSVSREIQQRKKIETLASNLEEVNAELKENDQQKDELLSIVSHQLATPVSSVKWYLEMFRDGDLGKVTKEQKEHLESLMGISQNLSDLVSMILDVSRIQLGRIHIEKQELDLNVFFKEILEVIKPKAEEKKVKLEVKMPSKLPVAMLDRRYTHMTIENLLSNAVKYTPEGGLVHFTIELKENILYCEVKDTGVGIPKADQEKIFGRMFRASNVRNQIDGNGFGLYIAKGAVEAQGGKIWFNSEEGKGTCFSITLPIKTA